MDEDYPMSIPLGILGCALGGALGFVCTTWLYKQGYYAMLIPGAFMGFGGALFSRVRSYVVAMIAGLGGLALGVYTQWTLRPWLDDRSLRYFVENIEKQEPLVLGMIVGGAALGFYLGIGRGRIKKSKVKVPTVTDDEVDAHLAEEAAKQQKQADD